MYKRKTLKRQAKQAVRRHFAMYLALCLLAAILGTEFSSSLTFSKIDTSGVFVSSGAPSSQTLGDVVDALMEGRPKRQSGSPLKYGRRSAVPSRILPPCLDTAGAYLPAS